MERYALDGFLSRGEKSVICVQSHLPALAELTMLYMNYVTVSRLERNPTVKQEIVQRGFQRDIPVGMAFISFGVSPGKSPGFGATAR